MKQKPLVRREDLIRQLEKEVKRAGSQKEWADKFGVSASYVNDVLKRGKPIGEKMANALGYRRVEGFELLK